MEITPITPGQLIKYYRCTRNMSQLDLANKCGVSVKAIYNWERDLNFPRHPELVAKALEISLSRLEG